MPSNRSRASIILDTDFDGGAATILRADTPGAIDLALRADSASPDFMQWFHFRARGVGGRRCRFRIMNAGEATFADAYKGYRVCASYDGERWFRVPTTFDGSVLTFRHTPEEDEVLYAYFAAYPRERHEALISRAEASPRARVERLGETVQGRSIDLVIVGEREEDGDDEGDEPRRIWITARQHPGETAAEWLMEGLLERLLDEDDPVSAALLDQAVFYLVPCMNPDGGVLGNLRTNAAGTDLNRSWREPSPEESPEVFFVREAMLERGVDLFLDVHADERTPYCFTAGCEGNPDYTERIEALEELFESALLEASDDYQREVGYDTDLPGQGNLATAGNWVGERFDCLSLTLEMPFQDNENQPDAEQGWSPERSARLGGAVLDAILASVGALR